MNVSNSKVIPCLNSKYIIIFPLYLQLNDNIKITAGKITYNKVNSIIGFSPVIFTVPHPGLKSRTILIICT